LEENLYKVEEDSLELLLNLLNDFDEDVEFSVFGRLLSFSQKLVFLVAFFTEAVPTYSVKQI